MAPSIKALAAHAVVTGKKKLKRTFFLFAWGGRKYQCNICGDTFRRFVGLQKIADGRFVCPVIIRGKEHSPMDYEFLNIRNFACPRCGAPDKARLMGEFFVREGFERLRNSGKPLLHFEPEAGMAQFLGRAITDYRISTYPNGVGPHHFDLRDLTTVAGTLGCFIASHILEHIEEDELAAEQLYESLAPDGFGIILVPIMRGIEDTWENPEATSESDRWKYFGQNDHVRIYSKEGFLGLLENSGFSVRQLGKEYFSKSVFARLGITESAVLYVVEK